MYRSRISLAAVRRPPVKQTKPPTEMYLIHSPPTAFHPGHVGMAAQWPTRRTTRMDGGATKSATAALLSATGVRKTDNYTVVQSHYRKTPADTLEPGEMLTKLPSSVAQQADWKALHRKSQKRTGEYEYNNNCMHAVQQRLGIQGPLQKYSHFDSGTSPGSQLMGLIDIAESHSSPSSSRSSTPRSRAIRDIQPTTPRREQPGRAKSDERDTRLHPQKWNPF